LDSSGVAWTALDARDAGFETSVIEDACRGIDFHGSVAAAWPEMTRSGVRRIQSSDIDPKLTRHLKEAICEQ
jgi:nicotinamidase/pyrazinamidase